MPRALLKAGAKVELRAGGIGNKEGLTPLMQAAYSGHAEVVKALLAAKANVHARLSNYVEKGRTALMHAAQAGPP